MSFDFFFEIIFSFELVSYIQRMYCTYAPNHKFKSIKISVLRDIKKIWKKSSISKLSRFCIIKDYRKVITELVTKIWINNQKPFFPFEVNCLNFFFNQYEFFQNFLTFVIFFFGRKVTKFKYVFTFHSKSF